MLGTAVPQGLAAPLVAIFFRKEFKTAAVTSPGCPFSRQYKSLYRKSLSSELCETHFPTLQSSLEIFLGTFYGALYVP